MKRSSFLKSLGTFVMAPSLISELEPINTESVNWIVLEWAIPYSKGFFYIKAKDNLKPISTAVKTLKINYGESYHRVVVPDNYTISDYILMLNDNK